MMSFTRWRLIVVTLFVFGDVIAAVKFGAMSLVNNVSLPIANMHPGLRDISLGRLSGPRGRRSLGKIIFFGLLMVICCFGDAVTASAVNYSPTIVTGFLHWANDRDGYYPATPDSAWLENGQRITQWIAAPLLAYVVNSNGDTNAVNLVTGTDAGGNITLRSAIQAATAQPGSHTITFSGAVVSPINLTLGQITVGNAANGNNITITGPGMNSLTVNQTTENRIFSTGTGAVTFLLQDITLNYTGPAVTPYSGGGGAIIAGGAGAATTLINCRISNFQRQIGNGGAISASSSLNNHSLTITNSIFTNNRAGGAGGAVSFNSQGGTATITGSTFDNNHTGPVGANTGGDGGAINLSGGGSGGTYLVEKNTFLNNQVENVTGHAGAIMSTNGTATIRYNRFVGNTCLNVSFPPLANIIGQAGGATIHVTNADNNWWGLNTGPGANDATALAAGAVMNLTQWLQLKTTASPSPICNTPAGLGNTFTVTTSFLNNSAGTAISVTNLSRLIGLPVTWTSALGSLSSQQTTIQSGGTATALFTSNGTGGTATVNAQVDNIPASETSPARASVTVNTIPTAITSPNATTFAVGSNGMFSLTASGSPAPTFSKTGALPSAVNLSSAGLLSGTPAAATGGTYPIVVTASNVCGSAPTQNFTLTVVGSISGTITYPNATAPPQFISNVLISGAGSPPVSTTTLVPGVGAGTYLLSGLLGAYTVTPTKPTGGVNGISSFDAAKIAQHVAGVPPLLNATQRIAADVSNNGVVSSFDAGQIATFVATGSSPGIAGTWRFFTPGPTFPVGASPTSRTYPSVNSNFTGDDYVGILVGEVSGNWNPSAPPIRPANGHERSIAVKVPDLVTQTDNEVILPITVDGVANKGIISYEFDLRYDPSVIVPQANLVDVVGTVSGGLTAVTNTKEPGLLRVVLYGPMSIDSDGLLLNLRFTAIGAPGLLSPLTIERIMFNEGMPRVMVTDGHVEIAP